MSDRTRFSLRDGMELAGIDLGELWRRYVEIGGSQDPASVALCVLDPGRCDQREHDLIAHALNEAFLDHDLDTFPVGYLGSSSPPHAISPAQHRPPAGTSASSRSLEARRQAALARMRSAAAARRAAALHATAAQLMQSSGQLQLARHAVARAQAARQRGVRSPAA